MLYVIDSTVSNLNNVPFTCNFHCFGKQLLPSKDDNYDREGSNLCIGGIVV